jgi:hypothetical protein
MRKFTVVMLVHNADMTAPKIGNQNALLELSPEFPGVRGVVWTV